MYQQEGNVQVTVCSLVKKYWRFVENEDTTLIQTPIYFYQYKRRNILKDLSLQQTPGEHKISHQLNAFVSCAIKG